MNDTIRAPIRPVRSSWNSDRFLLNGPLTDAKIDAYAKDGWYSDAFRAARRARWEAKQQKRAKREGNFILEGGRLIYSPE